MYSYLMLLIKILALMTLLLFCTVYISGKRPIAELPVFDFLAILVLGSIVGSEFADPNFRHLYTAFSIIIVCLLQRLISYGSIKSKRFRAIVSFEPTIIIQDGKFVHKNLKKIRYKVNDVLMLLRGKDVFDLNKIAFAIIEPSGKISVLKKPEYESITLKDMKIPPNNCGMPLTIILDGELEKDNITKLGLTEADVLNKMQQLGFEDNKSIFFASMDACGNTVISPYDFKVIQNVKGETK